MATSALPWVLAGGGLLAIGLVAATSQPTKLTVKAGGVYRFYALFTGLSGPEATGLKAGLLKTGATDVKVQQSGEDTLGAWTQKAAADHVYTIGEPFIEVTLEGRNASGTINRIEQITAPPSK